MTDAQSRIQVLRDRGWSSVAIARELGVSFQTVDRWIKGARSPENGRAVLALLDQLLRRKRIPA